MAVVRRGSIVASLALHAAIAAGLIVGIGPRASPPRRGEPAGLALVDLARDAPTAISPPIAPPTLAPEPVRSPAPPPRPRRSRPRAAPTPAPAPVTPDRAAAASGNDAAPLAPAAPPAEAPPAEAPPAGAPSSAGPPTTAVAPSSTPSSGRGVDHGIGGGLGGREPGGRGLGGRGGDGRAGGGGDRAASAPPPRVSKARPARLIWPRRTAETDRGTLVLLIVSVDDDGFVTGVRIKGASPRRRDEQAADAAWKFRYDPARDHDGRPIASKVDQPVVVL